MNYITNTQKKKGGKYEHFSLFSDYFLSNEQIPRCCFIFRSTADMLTQGICHLWIVGLFDILSPQTVQSGNDSDPLPL